MIFSKKNTYEQHDNEEGSFYKSSVNSFKGSRYLNNYLEVDVCIIGGGLTGLITAVALSKLNLKIEPI